MSSGWGSGSTRAWRRIRELVLKRDQYLCQLKIEGTCRYRADCVHHTMGKAMGDDPQYLVASCTPCNLKVGDPTAGARDPEPRPTTVFD